MKNLCYIFIMTLVITMAGSCTTSSRQEEAAPAQAYVTGEVQEIQPGKDGYTAKIMTDDQQVYFATISIPNLDKKANQYRVVDVGETLTVRGEFWKMNDETHITVRELK